MGQTGRHQNPAYVLNTIGTPKQTSPAGVIVTGDSIHSLGGKTWIDSHCERMYTHCPECNTAYRITISELRSGQGQVICSKCNAQFDAISYLSDVAFEDHTSEYRDLPILSFEQALSPPVKEEVLEDNASVSLVRADHLTHLASRSSRNGWLAGIALLICVAIIQFGFFEAEALAQNPTFRPWLESSCELFGCELSKYRNPYAIDVLEKNLVLVGASLLEFRLVIANSAAIAQAFPRLQLVLLRSNGETLAQRIFFPEEYFKNKLRNPDSMPVGKPFQIKLQILNPGASPGGYHFNLL